MRILYDHQVFSLQDAGGASRYHYELLHHLSQVPDVRADLQLGVSGTILPFQQLSSPQTRVRSWHWRLRPGICRYLANEILGNSIAACSGKVDVYHPTLYRRMPMVRTRRLIVTHHDCTHERFPELFPDVSRILAAKRRLFSQADAIICVSESSRRDLLKFYAVDSTKTRVIHHGLNRLSRCDKAAERLAQLVRRDYLLFVGSRAAYKNFHNLLRAFREAGLQSSFDLLVVGGGQLMPEEKSLVKDLGLEESIIVLPLVTDRLLAEAYSGARLFVYPSLCEGFGFPPLEAMAAGCPVLVSNTSSLPEVCRDAPFYFNPEDQGSLFYALQRATSDQQARTLAIERGITVTAEYSWSKCAEETLALYRECQ
jgi:glycosyltransferase involved in cell wall biosynthesis